jgi:hypothetical protein
MVELEERHMNSKPNWKDLPKEAKYIAQDKNGDWFWFDNKPTIKETVGEWRVTEGKCVLIPTLVNGWVDTLEERSQ